MPCVEEAPRGGIGISHFAACVVFASPSPAYAFGPWLGCSSYLNHMLCSGMHGPGAPELPDSGQPRLPQRLPLEAGGVFLVSDLTLGLALLPGICRQALAPACGGCRRLREGGCAIPLQGGDLPTPA